MRGGSDRSHQDLARASIIPRSAIPLSMVLAFYTIAMFLIPTLAPVGVSDDWTYARSVEYLVRDHRYYILPVAAATQVFQLFWGALFALLFGLNFGALRLSTIALVFLSGIAIYGICRELGIDRNRSALGTAVYLFNPVLFPITYSFMSDPQFLGLLVISTYWYVRGLRGGGDGEISTLLGSAVASFAVLQRPHGALIPLGVATYLLIAGRLPANRHGVGRLLRVALAPAITFLTYYLVIARGLPTQQSLFLDEIRTAGWGETWLLFRRLTVIEVTYIGLFVFPIAFGVIGAVWKLLDLRARRTWLVLGAWQTIVIAGAVWFWSEGRRMPFIPHFLGRGGPGSGDLRNARPPLAAERVFDWITIFCVASALIFGLSIIRKLDEKHRSGAPVAGMLLGIGGWQALGVVPQSFLFRNWVISLDRYLLPLLPFTIALLLWALNGWRVNNTLAWSATAMIALFAVVGTRDALVFQDDVWTLATALNGAGVADTKLDAGYAWDAYHLWEFGEQYQIPQQTPDGTWWTDVYARPTDSTYVIAGGPLAGYDVISVTPYSAWLQRSPVELFVLRRQGAPDDDVQWGGWSGHANIDPTTGDGTSGQESGMRADR